MVGFYQRLISACKSGDAEFVSHCIADNEDRGRNINWYGLLITAYEYDRTDIVMWSLCLAVLLTMRKGTGT